MEEKKSREEEKRLGASTRGSRHKANRNIHKLERKKKTKRQKDKRKERKTPAFHAHRKGTVTASTTQQASRDRATCTRAK